MILICHMICRQCFSNIQYYMQLIQIFAATMLLPLIQQKTKRELTVLSFQPLLKPLKEEVALLLAYSF